MLYVAFERAGSGKLKPSEAFNRIYHTVPHVKSAVAMRGGVGGSYALESEVDGLLTFKPKKPSSPKLFFVDVENAGIQRLGVLQKQKPNGSAKKPVKAAAAGK